MIATCGRNGSKYPLRAYDDGAFEGYRIFIYAETMGPVGVVRAKTWEDAYSICEDEIFDDADPADPFTYARDYDPTAEEGEPGEGFGYRNNGVPTPGNGLSSPMYGTDLNGSALVDIRSPEGRRMVREWRIRLTDTDPVEA